MPEVPRLPVELLVLVNKRVYDYLGRDPRATASGCIKVVEGERIDVEVYLNCITTPNTISKVLEWKTTPLIWVKDIFGERYVEGTQYKSSFLANPKFFDPKTKELCLEFCYAGGDKVKVQGWRVRGFWVFTWGQFGEFETLTLPSAKKEVWFKLEG